MLIFLAMRYHLSPLAAGEIFIDNLESEIEKRPLLT